jgi:hypothetical protein
MTNAKIETLQDRFVNGTLDTSVWDATTDRNGTAFLQTPAFSYGLVTCPGESGGSVYSGIASVGSYDLAESGLSVELFSVDPAASADFLVQDSAGNSPNLWVNPTGPTLEFAVGPDSIVVATVPYSAVDHRFLRICESGGTVYADTSPDGAEWANLGSVATGALDASSVRVQFNVGDYPTSAVAAQWGNIGYVPVSSRLVDPGFTSR